MTEEEIERKVEVFLDELGLTGTKRESYKKQLLHPGWTGLLKEHLGLEGPPEPPISYENMDSLPSLIMCIFLELP